MFDYAQFISQWILSFVILSVMIAPWLRFRKIALEKGEKGWPYLLAGMAVGFACMQLVFLPVRLFLGPSESSMSLAPVGLVIAHVLAAVAVRIFRRKMTR